MRPLLSFLTLVLLATAGCLGIADAPPADDSSTEAAIVAGADESLDASAPAPATLREVPIAWDGNTGRYFCAPTGPGSCAGPSLSGSNDFLMIEEEGVASIDLTVTWDAMTPLAETLLVDIVRITPCGEDCYEATEAGSASGSSPLSLSLADLALGPGESMAISVTLSSDCQRVAVLLGCVAVSDQEFRVEGTILAA